MIHRKLTLEFYPQTITDVLLDDHTQPYSEVTRIQDNLGVEEARLWSSSPRSSRAHINACQSNFVSLTNQVPISWSSNSASESILPRIKVTTLRENLGEKETKSWLSSSRSSSTFRSSENGILTPISERVRTLQDLPLPPKSAVKGRNERKQVGFNRMTNNIITQHEQRIKIFSHVQTSIPSHVIPKKSVLPRPIESKNIWLDRKSLNNRKESVGKIRRVMNEWKLDCAIQREKDGGCLNQRKLREIRFCDKTALSLETMNQEIFERKKSAKIIVIGAGLSGLSAAHKLLSRKFKNVTILEALDRVGGRIHCVTDDNNPNRVIELGVPGIHHFKPWNTVFTLASKNSLISEPMCEIKSEEIQIFNWLGNKFSKGNHKKALLFAQALEGSSSIVKQINNVSKSMVINLSYRDYVREKTRRLFNKMSGIEAEEPRLSDLACQMSCFVQDGLCRLGNSKGTIAVQHMDSDTRDSACVVRLARGMSSLCIPLMKYFKNDTVQYKCQVESIEWSTAYTHDVKEGSNQKVKVTCKNGRVFTAHHVIVTLPLGYLKQHALTIFSPHLPESKLQAIERLGFGSVSKVFLHYCAPFWSESVKFIWTDSVDMDHDLCDKDAILFTARADDAVIEVTTSGTYLDDVCDSYLKTLLTSIIVSYFQLEIPEPSKITRSFWSTNPFFGGTHPYMSQTSSKEDVKELAAPILSMDTPILLFAGDATYENYTCLSHAARASGLREAIRLETFYDKLYKYKNRNKTIQLA